MSANNVLPHNYYKKCSRAGLYPTISVKYRNSQQNIVTA